MGDEEMVDYIQPRTVFVISSDRRPQSPRIVHHRSLCPRLFLLSEPQRLERHSRHFDHLEPHSGDITDRVSRSTKSRNENLVVLVNEVETAIRRHERCDLFTILNQLHSNTFSNRRVWLFRLNPQSLCDNAFCVGSSLERIGLQRGERVLSLILLLGPFVSSPDFLQSAGGSDTF